MAKSMSVQSSGEPCPVGSSGLKDACGIAWRTECAVACHTSQWQTGMWETET